VFGINKELKNNIKELDEGDFSHIPWLFCVLPQEKSHRNTIAKAFERALRKMSINDIVRIDEQMRQTTSMEWFINWREQKIEGFFTEKMSKEERCAIIVFASFNPNGFIREEAVRMLKDYDGALPYIILRQNDWVEQVHQAAASSFDKRINCPAIGEIIDSLPYIERLNFGKRNSHQEKIKIFFNRLNSPEHREDLKKGLQSENVKTRRFCVNALFEAGEEGILKIIKCLKMTKDPFLKAMIFRRLCLQKIDLKDIARIFVKDKFYVNRILALQYLNEEQTKDCKDIARRLLLDRNFSVRELAREILPKYEKDFDMRAFYIEKLKSININIVARAITGLGEAGEAEDTQYIVNYLKHSEEMIVRSAIVALMKLSRDKFIGILPEMLRDSRLGIVKTAQKLILKYDFTDYEKILEIFWEIPYEYTKIKCVQILFSATKWNRLIYMLKTLPCDVESVKNLSLKLISNWLFHINRSWVQVNEQQKERIYTLMKKTENQLPESMKRMLEFVLE